MRSSAVPFLCTIILACAALPIHAGDMSLELDDGEEIILHENGTWSFDRGVHQEPTEDIVIYLEGGQPMLIATDHTWKYINRKAARNKSKPLAPVNMIYVIGKYQGEHINPATQKAMSIAKTKLKKRMRKVVGWKVPDKKLTECIQMADKDVEKTDNFTDKWNVQIKITLDKYGIEEIMECCQRKPEPAKKSE